MGVTETIKVKDMFCAQCEKRISGQLRQLEGVTEAEANYRTGRVTVTFDPGKCSLEDIRQKIEETGYTVEKEKSNGNAMINGISILVILLAGWYIMNAFGWNTIFQKFPTATTGMSYAALFVIGILTSFHCIAMCGGLNLAATTTSNRRAAIYYNAGRLVSYTVIGGVLGLIGSVFSINLRTRAVIGLLAAIVMLFLGIRLMNCFPSLPIRRRKRGSGNGGKGGLRSRLLRRGSGSFYIGLINGLMPCGPLQSMQLLAISTGSFLVGGLSMFFFCLGTIPLMLAIGLAASSLTAKAKQTMALVGGALVFVFGIYMLQNNLALLGANLPSLVDVGEQEVVVEAVVEEGVQTATSMLRPGSYDVLKVKAGIPVRWTIIAGEGSLNGCNGEIVIPAYDVDVKLQLGENLVEFTPQKAGTVNYSCWMGMIKSEIIVTEA